MSTNLIVTNDAETTRLESTRSCGPCTACCVLPRIPDLGKLGYRPCKYLYPTDAGGCGCYTTRPDVCREYQCLWRMGRLVGDERRRPDRLGLMVGVDQIDDRVVVEVWELWEGAAREYPGRVVVEALARWTRLTVRFYGVPCSLVYRGPGTLDRGRELSTLARTDPKTLAAWIEGEMEARRMHRPDAAATVDLDLYRAGEPVQPWYERGGRLALEVTR